MQTNKTRDVLVGVAVVIIILLLIFYFVRRGQSGANLVEASPLPLPTQFSQFQNDLQKNFGIVLPDTAVKADLKDVSGGNQMGLVTFDKSSGQNVYTVIANLNDPPQGYTYQAWLVKDTDYVSMGVLSLEKGGWISNFTSSKDISDHKSVWVTLQRFNVSTPEKHILEGSF